VRSQPGGQLFTNRAKRVRRFGGAAPRRRRASAAMEDLFGGTEIKQKGPIDTSLYGQLWTHGMKPGLGLPAPKMVIIQEWPVGLLLRVMQLGTILYLVFSAITQQQYLMFKVPTGAVFPMLSDGTLTQAQLLLAEQVTPFLLPPCAKACQP
jgi:hypothetical protein